MGEIGMSSRIGAQLEVNTLKKREHIVTVVPLHSAPGALIAGHAPAPGVIALVRKLATDAKFHTQVVQFAAAKAELFCEQVCADYLVGRGRWEVVNRELRQGSTDIVFGIMGHYDIGLVKDLPELPDYRLIVTPGGERKIWERVADDLFLSKPFVRKREYMPRLFKFDHVLFIL